MRSRRTLRLVEALEVAGHTNVCVRWLPVVVGQRTGYLFTSYQQVEEVALGHSLEQALANVVARRVA